KCWHRLRTCIQAPAAVTPCIQAPASGHAHLYSGKHNSQAAVFKQEQQAGACIQARATGRSLHSSKSNIIFMIELLFLFLLGIMSGIVAGLFGLGGGILFTPILFVVFSDAGIEDPVVLTIS